MIYNSVFFFPTKKKKKIQYYGSKIKLITIWNMIELLFLSSGASVLGF